MASNEAREQVPPAQRSYKRKRKLIRKDLQLRIVFGTLFVALFVVVFSLQVPFLGLWLLQQVSPQSVESVYDLFSKLLLATVGISLLLTIPLSIWMGVAFSFHFCGPIHRIKLYFEELLQGRWDSVLNFRKTDDLQDIKDVINRFMDSARERVNAQAGLIESARNALAKSQGGQLSSVEAASLVQKLDAALAARGCAARGAPASTPPRGCGDAQHENAEETEAVASRG
jgi:methyl-accepting chemotaxis protein